MFMKLLTWIFGNSYSGPSTEKIARDMNTPLSPEEYKKTRVSDEWCATMKTITETHSDPDKWRETMFEASLKQRLVTYKEVVTTVVENRSLEEVKQIFIERSPTSLYISEYSRNKPCIHITKQIMPSHGGVWMYYDSWGDKTPKFYDWESFYFTLCQNGLERIRF